MKTVWTRALALLSPSEDKTLFVLSCLIGAGTGVGSGLFIRLVEAVQFWPAVPGKAALFGVVLSRPLLVAVPALGGLLCGAVLQFLDPAVKGTGTPEMMHAVRRKDGFIGGRYTAFKTLASVFTVCSGGAAGPEAPMVAVGAGLGSWAGRRLGLGGDRLRTLVAAGAAAGFAAVFNAPIAGVLFAVEVLLKEFAAQAFTMVILASVTASVVTQLILGERVFVEVPNTFVFRDARELGFYFVLAVLAGVFSKLFVATAMGVEKRFERVSAPLWRAALGGLLLGLLGLLLPEALGNGHLVIPRMVSAESGAPWAWTLLAAILFGKMLACPLTVGSGGSGGIFIPYLLMGGALGGLVGRAAGHAAAWAAPPGAYMLVGMGAVFAGITYAPFTAIILLFELTRDYSIVLPLMFAVGITLLVARMIDPVSLEGRKLLKKGVKLHEHPELRALERYHVRDVMSRAVRAVPESWTLHEIAEFVGGHPHTGYPVVDAGGRPVGLIAYAEMRKAFSTRAPEGPATARDIMRRSFPTVGPDEPLERAVGLMQTSGADRVLVVDPGGEPTLIGVVTKGDVLSIYSRFFEALPGGS